ncbi:hypothetical protein ACH347_27450 [Saccharopolyspora sp. 5N102]|uniref:hypothetical protein n=1 Tax=Saccharopolyspora sp. 5N102 TaxID=3375155 RepID=UPI0037B95BD5
MINDGQTLAPACFGMLPDLNRERERIDQAMASLLAARDALDTIIDATVSAGVDDLDACDAAGAAKIDFS